MSDAGPTRSQSDLAAMVEMLLDKGIVVNADITVSIGQTELLGVQVRAAIASFETAAEYGLEFPEGTDTEKVEAATRREGGMPPIASVSARPGGPADAEDDADETDEAEGETDTDGETPEATVEETDDDG